MFRSRLNKTIHNALWKINRRDRGYSTGLGDLGGGAGKGGGGGGSIRSSGGAFGKRQAALEEEYFHKLRKKQLADLKKELEAETNVIEMKVPDDKGKSKK